MSIPVASLAEVCIGLLTHSRRKWVVVKDIVGLFTHVLLEQALAEYFVGKLTLNCERVRVFGIHRREIHTSIHINRQTHHLRNHVLLSRRLFNISTGLDDRWLDKYGTGCRRTTWILWTPSRLTAVDARFALPDFLASTQLNDMPKPVLTGKGAT